MMNGDFNPMPATPAIRPSDVARLYAGAVDATPMTMLERSPIALPLSPLSFSGKSKSPVASAPIPSMPIPPSFLVLPAR